MDPLTAISIFGPMAAQLVGGLRSNQRMMERTAKEEADARQEVKKRRATLPQYEIADSYNKFLQMSRQDAAADLEREAASQREASTLGALKAGGARSLLGGTQRASQQSALERGDIEARSQQRQMDAMNTYATNQQNVMSTNFGYDRRLAERELMEAKGSAQAARKARLEAEERKRALITDGISAGLGAVGSLGGLFDKATAKGAPEALEAIAAPKALPTGVGEKSLQTPASPMVSGLLNSLNQSSSDRSGTVAPSLLNSLGSSFGSPLVSNQGTAGPLEQQFFDAFGTEVSYGPESRGVDMAPIPTMAQKGVLESLMSNPAFISKFFPNGLPASLDPNVGAAIYDNSFMYKDGGNVKKTKGEFSHETNPIDIIQDGEKVGEMTGGESILNPTQAKKIQKYAEDGDSDLHKYVRNLFNKFNKK